MVDVPTTEDLNANAANDAANNAATAEQIAALQRAAASDVAQEVADVAALAARIAALETGTGGIVNENGGLSPKEWFSFRLTIALATLSTDPTTDITIAMQHALSIIDAADAETARRFPI